jgi:bifunctional non-homologous end joining protein LigD
VQLHDEGTVEACEAPRVDPAVDVAPAAVSAAAPEKTVPFTNLDKVFWPEEGYTKGDLIEYYREIAPRLMPYLVDRPVVLTRYPDGIHGKSFYQKDAPGFVPEWIRTETMWSEGASREIRYFVVEDEAGLAYLANLGTIPLHLWSSRVGSLQYPDWCILDLDPKRAPFSDVIKIARALRALCNEIGLPSFVKTSGSTGLHVLLPLGGRCTHEQSTLLAELLARVVVADLGDIATLVRAVGDRGDRVYVDYMQNGQGKLLVAPYSVRPLPGAPVSAPLRWSEVSSRLDIRQHTIRTMPGRLKRMKEDPLLPILDTEPDLDGAMAALAARLGREKA